MFLTDDIATQAGTFALVPQVVDAVRVPVIAAGGIADGRGVAAAFALGAAAAQIGTAYLFTPQSLVSDIHRAALRTARDDGTALTNLFFGAPGARLDQSGDARNRADVGFGAGLPHRRRRPGAPGKRGPRRPGPAISRRYGRGRRQASAARWDAGELTRQLAEDAARRIKALAAPG